MLPEFQEQFDRSHWWSVTSPTDPAAALYELARRHPYVFLMKQGILKKPDVLLDPVWFLVQVGFKSWPKLSAVERLCWHKVAGKRKGVDFRDAEYRCFSVEDSALSEIAVKRVRDFKNRKKTLGQVCQIIENDMRRQPPGKKEVEALISQITLSVHRAGYLIIAIDPELNHEEAQARMAKEFIKYRNLHRIVKRRARPDDWLDLISAFEAVASAGQKDKQQAFVRYRRALDEVF